MAEMRTAERPQGREIIERYGSCLELVPMDESFHDTTVGLYVKDGVFTVWTYSRQPGVEDRIEQILRDLREEETGRAMPPDPGSNPGPDPADVPHDDNSD